MSHLALPGVGDGVGPDTGDGTLEGFVRRIAPSASEADREDIVQETRLRELSHASSAPTDDAGLGRWRRSIARNLVRDRWRRSRITVPAEAPGEAPSVEEQLVALVEGDLVRAAFARLSPLFRQVLFLRVVERRPAAEVADLLGRNPADIRQIQHRALVRLRSELVGRGWTDHAGERR